MFEKEQLDRYALSDSTLMSEYNLDTNSSSGHFLIYSFSKSASSPVRFTHYKHEHRIPEQIAYQKLYNYCTIYFFLSGKFGFIFDRSICNPSYGDAVIIRDREHFTSLFYAASHVDYYEIDFPIEFFNEIDPINPFAKLFYEKNSEHIISLDEPKRESILKSLKHLDELSADMNHLSDFFAYSHLLQIIEALCSHNSKESPSLLYSKSPAKLKTAIDYIHQHFTTLNGAEEVAEFCHITPTYLARIFKKSLFCSTTEYITRLRISHAKYLLQNGYSITDTCYQSGFSNYTYFISKFKRITGMTPSKFKAEIK